jgi:glycosyltransferase involved in cell wall biosynthesis
LTNINSETDHASDNPRYSVIVATFNRSAYLDNCLASLASQRLAATYEVVIVDDGSPDSTPKFGLNYSRLNPTIFKIVRQTHRGLAAARNLGILTSTREVIIFLDDDSIVPIDFLQNVDSILMQDQIDVLGFVDLPMTNDSYLAKGGRHLENFSRRFLKRNIVHRIKAHIAVKRRVPELSGLFDESRTYRMAEDTELNDRLAQVTASIKLVDRLYVYHRSPSFTGYLRESFLTLRSSWTVPILSGTTGHISD